MQAIVLLSLIIFTVYFIVFPPKVIEELKEMCHVVTWYYWIENRLGLDVIFVKATLENRWREEIFVRYQISVRTKQGEVLSTEWTERLARWETKEIEDSLTVPRGKEIIEDTIDFQIVWVGW